MSSADSHPTTRRHFVRLAGATLPALALACDGPAPALAARSGDPIFGAIARHKEAVRSFDRIVTAQARIEEAIPECSRRGDPFEIVETDDSRWTEYERRWLEACERTEDRAIDLLKIQPTTFAGLSALLRYAARQRNEWPDAIEDDAGRRTDFPSALSLHVADTLDTLIANATR